MSGHDRESLTDVLEWSGNPHWWSGDPPKCLGVVGKPSLVVGRPSLMSGCCRESLPDVQ